MSKKQHQWLFKQQGSNSATGPVTEAQFVALVKKGTIRGSTLVMSPSRTENKWVAAKQIPAVAKLIKPQPPKRPAPRASKAPRVENVVGAASASPANPYNAPVTASVVPEPRSQVKAAQEIYKKFQPLKSTAVVWLLRVTILVMAIHCILFWCLIKVGRSNSAINIAQMGTFVIQLVLVLATAIFFLRWKYRAYKNLQAACDTPMKTSAGWSIGCYFVPLINLYRPATAMHEIQSRSKANIGYSVYGWWFLWILSGLLARATMNTRGAIDYRVYTISIVGLCLAIIAGFLMLKIIRTVTEKQRRYLLSLEKSSI